MNAPPVRCLLIVDEPASGVWNMAIDEALLQQAPQLDCCILRFYQWAEPTLSLGYFQQYIERQSHTESLACPIVRRSSGGGAIVHDSELTYSLIVPRHIHLAKKPRQLYHLLHTALQQSLTKFSVEQTRLVSQPERKDQPQPFLCFQRRSEFDLLLAGSTQSLEAKICGSAQRRASESMIQHGSILLSSSSAAPQLPGILEIAGIRIDPLDLQSVFSAQIAKNLGLEYELSACQPEVIQLAAEIGKAKYAAEAWTHKR